MRARITLLLHAMILAPWALGGGSQSNNTDTTSCAGDVDGLGNGLCEFANNNEASWMPAKSNHVPCSVEIFNIWCMKKNYKGPISRQCLVFDDSYVVIAQLTMIARTNNKNIYQSVSNYNLGVFLHLVLKLLSCTR